MMKNNKNVDPNEIIKKNLSVLFSLYPLIGLGISVISVLFVMMKGREWSVPLVAYTFIPFLGNSAICVAAYLMLKDTITFELCFFKGKLKYLTIFLVIVFAALQIMFFELRTGVEIQEISVEKIDDLKENEDVYYVIFGAENCLYCKDMQNVYEQAFSKEKIRKIYYCDISYESYDNEQLKKLNIDSIPILIKFENGKVLKRLIGVRKTEDIIKFIEEE